jgi:hypothetical protein
LRIAEVVAAAAAVEEIVMHFKVVAEEIAMRSRTERRVPVHLRKRRNQRLI